MLNLFKAAAEKINKLGIDHWQYWKNPPEEKINWIKEGIKKEEFYFIRMNNNNILGMLRIMNEDLTYWGKQDDKAKYIHSLVIKDKYSGLGIGNMAIQKVEVLAKNEKCKYLRLDADSQNLKLCTYYEKQGFKHVGLADVLPSPCILFEKELVYNA